MPSFLAAHSSRSGPSPLLVLGPLLLGCRSDPHEAPVVERARTERTEPLVPTSGPPPAASPPAGQDVLSTRLTLDVGTLRGRAEVTMAATSSPVRSLRVGDLEIAAVSADGQPLDHEVHDGTLDVHVPGPPRTATLVIDYAFGRRDGLDGYVGEQGVSFLWPTACERLFPCHPSPEDGTTFELSLRGVPPGQVAIHPSSIAVPAPPYMVAFALGDYRRHTLGTTTAGTTVSVHALPGHEDEARSGAAHLLAAFDWLERTYGPYAFGNDVASVQVSWPMSGYAGMEHHPYWHVETGSIGDSRTHVHEAAHGWFGNGVRIRCWEDLVLSEGVTSYLTERAHEAVGGPSAWAEMETSHAMGSELDHEPAWPSGCTRAEPVLSSVVYVEGALFMRAVEEKIGRARLDAALADFYQRRVGTAASMQELIEAIEQHGREDLDPLVGAWLR